MLSHVIDGAGDGHGHPIFSQHGDVRGSLSVGVWCDVVEQRIMGNTAADHRPYTVSKLDLSQNVCFLFTKIIVILYVTNLYCNRL